jgi:polar amino acid transport system substrate-binding protein
MQHFRVLLMLAFFGFPLTLAAQDNFVLAAEDDWYPYSAKHGAGVKGLSIELMTAAFEAAGAKVSYEVVPFSRAMAGVKSGRYAGCFNVGKNEQLKVDYLVPDQLIGESVQTVWGGLNASPVNSYQQLEGKTVGITNGYSYDSHLTNNDKIIKETARIEVSNLKKLARGRIDYTIVDRWVAMHLISANKAELQGKIKPLGELQLGAIVPVFSKTHPDGAKAMHAYEKGMKIIKANGSYGKIIKAWMIKSQG